MDYETILFDVNKEYLSIGNPDCGDIGINQGEFKNYFEHKEPSKLEITNSVIADSDAKKTNSVGFEDVVKVAVVGIAASALAAVVSGCVTARISYQVMSAIGVDSFVNVIASPFAGMIVGGTVGTVGGYITCVSVIGTGGMAYLTNRKS